MHMNGLITYSTTATTKRHVYKKPTTKKQKRCIRDALFVPAGSLKDLSAAAACLAHWTHSQGFCSTSEFLNTKCGARDKTAPPVCVRATVPSLQDDPRGSVTVSKYLKRGTYKPINTTSVNPNHCSDQQESRFLPFDYEMI